MSGNMDVTDIATALSCPNEEGWLHDGKSGTSKFSDRSSAVFDGLKARHLYIMYLLIVLPYIGGYGYTI